MVVLDRASAAPRFAAAPAPKGPSSALLVIPHAGPAAAIKTRFIKETRFTGRPRRCRGLIAGADGWQPTRRLRENKNVRGAVRRAWGQWGSLNRIFVYLAEAPIRARCSCWREKQPLRADRGLRITSEPSSTAPAT